MHLIKTFAAVIGLSVLNLQCSHPLSAETVPEKPTAGKQSKQIAVDPDQELSYLIYLPESYEDTPEKDYPLVLFLHGRGESHGPLELVAKWGPPKFAQRGDSLPFILISPQCPSSDLGEMQPDKLSLINYSKRSTKTTESIQAEPTSPG